ncbi:MAG: hypothetical protein HOO86_10455 [Bacteroidales bacterium]|nr:hypothetical protein [Bacteroidales bacterium]
MKKKLIFYVVFLTILLGSGCAKDDSTDAIDQELQLEELYQAAVEDAIIADSSEICDTLWSINAGNTKLEWRTMNNEQYVLAGNFNKHPESYSDSSLVNSWGVIWIFLPKQFRSRIMSSTIQNNDTLLRMRQLLGMPPSNTNNYIVELWVRPADLYRPAGDNEIDDHSAGLYLSPNANPEYVQWFNQNIYDSYFGDWTLYPWTRLGYTYDWANSTSEVGLSEFCIKENSVIYVKKLYPATEYLKN